MTTLIRNNQEALLIVCLIASAALLLLAALLTRSWRRQYEAYTSHPMSDTPKAQARREKTSLLARLAAAAAGIPAALCITLRVGPRLADKTFHQLGAALILGIALLIFDQADKIPFEKLWDPELSWPRQIGLVLLGAFAASVAVVASVLLYYKEVRAEIFKRLSGGK